ncbi:hypothetical protein KIPB_004158 [Kipferlia bialata]|uniref:Uncharacterized protein n=1 Tax=Kipferlia bialata TaxID=797122 RepID=A0A9K3CTC0_9EUKA|nr:hypothetical protein KIPB_004158 [Kipferlia bialata]|eukprot:g4158.t1
MGLEQLSAAVSTPKANRDTTHKTHKRHDAAGIDVGSPAGVVLPGLGKNRDKRESLREGDRERAKKADGDKETERDRKRERRMHRAPSLPASRIHRSRSKSSVSTEPKPPKESRPRHSRPSHISRHKSSGPVLRGRDKRENRPTKSRGAERLKSRGGERLKLSRNASQADVQTAAVYQGPEIPRFASNVRRSGKRSGSHSLRSKPKKESSKRRSIRAAKEHLKEFRQQQNEYLFSLLAEEQARETERELMFSGLHGEGERLRLQRIFGIERTQANERIMQVTAAQESALTDKIQALGLTQEDVDAM